MKLFYKVLCTVLALLALSIGVHAADDDLTTENTLRTDSQETTTDTNTNTDTDGDGVINTYDQCPQTPTGAIIVKPSQNINYAGCSCEQTRQLVYETYDETCIDFYCNQQTLSINLKQQSSSITDCPENHCKGKDYYVYPQDGYSRCIEGRIVEYSCAPTRIEYNSTGCGWQETKDETNQTTTTIDTADNTNITTQDTIIMTANETTKNTNETIDSENPINDDEIITNNQDTTNTTHTTAANSPEEDDETTQQQDTITKNTTMTSIPALRINDTETEAPKPRLDEEQTTVYLPDRQRTAIIARYAFPELVEQGTTQTVHLELTRTPNTYFAQAPEVMIILEGQEIRQEHYQLYEDDKDIYFLSLTNIPITNTQKSTSIIAQISYQLRGESTTTDDIIIPLNVKRVFNPPLINETRKQNNESDIPSNQEERRAREEAINEQLIEEVYEELEEKVPQRRQTKENYTDAIGKAKEHLIIERAQNYDQETNTTKHGITITPQTGKILKNVTIVEYIPKEIAASAQDIQFNIPPTQILQDDPLIMWHFEAVEERVDISYETKGETQATGNAILSAATVENRGTPWHIALPMMLIPLLVVLLVGIPRLLNKKKQ